MLYVLVYAFYFLCDLLGIIRLLKWFVKVALFVVCFGFLLTGIAHHAFAHHMWHKLAKVCIDAASAILGTSSKHTEL